MNLRFDQLAKHLQQQLLPIYLISGDEPLQMAEATDAVRAVARVKGFSERQVFHVEAGFDWNELSAASDTLSLFAEQRILELRIPSGKPGDAGSKALKAYAENPPQDSLLLISCGRLDKRQTQSKWYQSLQNAGAAMQIWPVEYTQLPAWITRRMGERGLKPTAEAAQLLADRVEGNLLAAAQEIDKLVLLHGEGSIDADSILEAVADSARYGVFELVDSALAGEAERTVRMLEGLRGEGIEPVLVLWALVREARTLETIAHELAGGSRMDEVFRKHRIWDKRKPLVQAGLKRHNLRRWQQLLRRANRIDRMIKGRMTGKPWDELVQFSLLMAGVRTL